MIVIDTSALVEALTEKDAAHRALREAFDRGERVVLPVLVLYEWLRGPRTTAQLRMQEDLLPTASAAPLTVAEAEIAARLYRTVERPRGREVDLAIAACALARDAALWAMNRRDFEDLPGIELITP